MSKEINYKSRIDFDNLPDPNATEEPRKKRPYKKRFQKKALRAIAFRLRPEIVHRLEKLVDKLQSKSTIRITKVLIMEICITYVSEQSTEDLLTFINRKMI